MDLLLLREYTPSATFGELYLDAENLDEPYCFSVERPWLDNKPMVSCVPEGTYTIVLHTSPKFGKVYYLENHKLGVSLHDATKRTHILIHPANWASQLLGCIALGKSIIEFPQGRGVTSSKATCRRFKSKLNGETHTLTIRGT
tara:strand:- start:737 stop:1165 length:429 start_codon:yes stop_codon:yes gene_type:complete